MQFKRIKDLVFGCAALILSVFYLVCSTQIKTRPKLTPGYASARIVPVLLGILLAVLSVLCLIQGVRKLKTKAGEEPHDQPRKGDVTAVLLTFAVIIAYIAALSPLGFCLSTALYLFVQMLVLAPKDKRNVALFLPVTYAMTSSNAMTLLMALFIGAISGGLISAILLRIPGTPSSVATCFDGHPLVEKGQAAKALGVGVVFSFLGTIFSTVLLMFIAPQIARVAITFGNTNLKGGFDMLAVMVGLFAVGEIISAAETSRHTDETVTKPQMKGIKGFGFSMQEFTGQAWNALRSALIGMGIGILPGIGGGTSNMMAYTVAKNSDKHAAELGPLGTGRIDGVVASETANNATIGGAMVPLLTLGIPGDTTTAMLLGALTLHGLTPVPLLFQNQADVVYGIFAAMLIASVIMLFMEFFGLRIFVKLLSIPKYILLPCVFVLCVIGAYALKNNMSQVIACLIFGIIGFTFKKLEIPTTPFILGFILGPLAEDNYRRGMIRTKGSFVPFLTSPISAVFLVIAVAIIVLYATKPMREKRKAAE